MRKNIFVLSFLLFTSSLFGQTESGRNILIEPASGHGQRRALLVGVNQYEVLKPLNYFGADATALKEVLVQLGFESGDIKLLTDGSGVEPTRLNIEEHLETLFEGLTENDFVLISLSGHGGRFTFRDAEGTRSESFFCPKDARVNRPERTMIPTREIYDALDKCPAKFKMLLIDACREEVLLPESEGAKSGIDESRSISEFAKSLNNTQFPKGTVALVSCAAGQLSYESPKLKQGVFMYHVVQGSLGKADTDGDGIVTLFELRDYVTQQTSRFVFREMERKQQRPYFHASWETADFGLFKVNNVLSGEKAKAQELRIKAKEEHDKKLRELEKALDSTDATVIRNALEKLKAIGKDYDEAIKEADKLDGNTEYQN